VRPRLVFVTQHVDLAHPALAATVPKIRALAERVDEVTVLIDSAVPGVLPANCRTRSFRSPWKAGRGLRFEAALARELVRRPSAVVAHMCPIYAVLAAPLARPLRIPLVLWYTHWHASPTLRLAARLASRIASVDARSFPLDSPKVTAIGHGIDLSEFSCDGAAPEHPDLRLVALGRYSAAKGLETVLRAVRLALEEGVDVRLETYGPALSAPERAHRRELEQLVEELDLGRRVRLGHAILRTEVPGVLARADALVNNMRAGAPDKAVYEAGASCLPVLASNPVFDELLDGLGADLRFDRDDPAQLAERITGLARMEPENRRRIGRALRDRVAERHSVESWADSLLRLAMK
jgi:glycosyltransferase involved in cell wall biosynthesis